MYFALTSKLQNAYVHTYRIIVINSLFTRIYIQFQVASTALALKLLHVIGALIIQYTCILFIYFMALKYSKLNKSIPFLQGLLNMNI